MARGRLRVAAGQTIDPDNWGNPIGDQTIQCFTSAADRDTQWPAPLDGAVCYLEDVKQHLGRVGGVWQAIGGVLAQQGQVSIALNNETKSVAITYPKPFKTLVYPQATVSTTVPNVTACAVSGQTATGFTLYGYRSTNANTTFNWLAIGEPA